MVNQDADNRHLQFGFGRLFCIVTLFAIAAVAFRYSIVGGVLMFVAVTAAFGFAALSVQPRSGWVMILLLVSLPILLAFLFYSIR